MTASPLDGVLVADFSRVLAGPLCTQTLGDLGADVVKVERPGSGDDTRHWGPPFHPDGTATYYLGLNRNKRSLTLDLKDRGDLELARRLALRADVLVESFRAGLMDELGLGYAALRERNPKLVYCSITAFGDAALPGYDLLLQAMSGLMSVTGDPDGPPRKVGAPLVDMLSGQYATIGILAAMASGTGQHVEVTLMDSALAGLLNQASAFLNAGVVGTRMGNRHPSIAPYETFGDLAVAVGNDVIFGRLCEAIGRPELAGDARFATNAARSSNRDALAAELEPILTDGPAREWASRLLAAGVPAGPVNTIDEAFAAAESLGLEPIDETGGVRSVRSPLRLSATPAGVRLPPPSLGEHDEQLRRWLSEDPSSPAPSDRAGS
jgi:crotonobetainyl-CoA:carnitine CoA-transferase CaiB-like acyl-CoA transferase